jgi:hypothetical protein
MCRVDVFDVSEGVRFTLKTWDTDRSDHMGKSIVAYVLQGPDGVIFEGCDFACSPLHATDSDDCISALLGFLTLRRGDVESDYFEAYTETQKAFRDTYAEDLAMVVYDRWGER